MRNDENRQKIWIVGLTFNELELNPNLFVLIKTGDIESPIVENGKILLFNEDALRKYLLKEYELFYLKEELCDELDIVLDIPILVKRIKSTKKDVKSIILDSLNILFDLTKHLYKGKRKNPNVSVFYSFSDHITFEKEFAESYFKENGVDRDELLNSIYWLVGLLFANSKMVYTYRYESQSSN
jgi:hypothetical protein